MSCQDYNSTWIVLLFHFHYRQDFGTLFLPLHIFPVYKAYWQVIIGFSWIRSFLQGFSILHFRIIIFFFMILLVAGIVLLHFNVKGSTRSIAKTFLIYGIGEFVAVMVARYLVPNFLPMDDLPLSFQDFITDAYTGVLAPLQWFSLGILLAGVALLLVSIFYRRDRVAEAED